MFRSFNTASPCCLVLFACLLSLCGGRDAGGRPLRLYWSPQLATSGQVHERPSAADQIQRCSRQSDGDCGLCDQVSIGVPPAVQRG